jgi:hypothetical protein
LPSNSPMPGFLLSSGPRLAKAGPPGNPAPLDAAPGAGT